MFKILIHKSLKRIIIVKEGNMKYTTENALKEIKRRAILIRQKRNKRITNYLAATASITLVVLFAVIRFFGY
jgi:hypothetical protein